MNTKIHFVLGGGTYPHLTGGMEIFNYYLIQALRGKFDISYTAYQSLAVDNIQFKKCFYLRPIKYFFPLQFFIHLLFSKDIRKVVFSYSAAHWIVWHLYRTTCRVLNRKYYVVIHYGDATPNGHEENYYRFFRDAEVVIAVSEDIKKNYDKKYDIHCKVLYPLVPFSYSPLTKENLRMKYQVPSGANVVSMIGSLKGMKNPETVIGALSLFTPEEMQRYRPHIVYAGAGSSMEKLKQMAFDYGVEKCVTFLGNIPKEKTCDIYKLSDIYLIASDFEGTSVSLLEAMFNRKPIITSRVPGIVNTICEGSECLMYTVKDAVGLKKCLLDYMSQAGLSDRLSSNAYEHYLCNYDYENVVSAYSEFLFK